MTRDDLYAAHETLCAAALDIMRAKNHDYAASDDPLRNLHACRNLGVSTALGIVVRLQDKLCRLANLTRSAPAVADESARDTALDVINYAVLYLAALESERDQQR